MAQKRRTTTGREQHEQVVFIILDKFEKLEELAQPQALNLTLLLNWMHHIIRHQERLVRLFSGVKIISELETD